MNDIIKKENEEISLQMLSAQRNLYKEAKNFHTFNTILCMVMSVVLGFLNVLCNECLILMQINAIYVFISIVIGPFLQEHANKVKSLAVRIQHLFDLYIYEWNWETFHFQDKPIYEDIKRNANSDELEELKNWYSTKIQEVSHTQGIVLCMKENVNYDISLRKKFIHFLYVIELVVFLVVLLYIIFSSKNVCVSISVIIVPLVPSITWLIDSHMKLKSDIKDCDELKKHVFDIIDKIKKNETIKLEELYKIQARIFENRLGSYSIPDCFYSYFRDKTEELTKYDTDKLIEEFSKACR